MTALDPRWSRWLWGRSLRRTLIRLVVLAILTWVVFGRLFPFVRIEGLSMEPSLRNGSIHLANRIEYRSAEPQRGDIVMIRMAGTRVMYAKRVLGVPGDRVAFEHGTLVVNGTPVSEPYVVLDGAWNMPAVTLGPGEYFVAGDNRSMPLDAHTLGTVRRDRIAGGLWR
ncbi:MAG: signal peptidase I [Kiritimatiellae bacterium]|nr:signal peptidase I [Kiritimatiellia bacterium]